MLASSDELAYFLLENAYVATVPGSGFGADSYLRLSFAVSDREVEVGSKKIVDLISSLK
jgi:aspartate aminotransferase